MKINPTMINPKIISRLIEGKPYYEIEYYDTILEDTIIGYGSYTKEFVEKWLEQEFDTTMTNRDMINTLTNLEFTLFIYRKMIPFGLRFVQTERGIEQWLSEKADETFWEEFQKEADRVKETWYKY